MKNLSYNFLRCAVTYALIGMAIGIYMAASNQHEQAPTHAHLNLLGWVSMAIMGLVYRAYPAMAEGSLPKIQFWLMNVGIIGMISGLALMFSGRMEFVPLTAASSLVVFIGMLLFAVVVYRSRTE